MVELKERSAESLSEKDSQRIKATFSRIKELLSQISPGPPSKHLDSNELYKLLVNHLIGSGLLMDLCRRSIDSSYSHLLLNFLNKLKELLGESGKYLSGEFNYVQYFFEMRDFFSSLEGIAKEFGEQFFLNEKEKEDMTAGILFFMQNIKEASAGMKVAIPSEISSSSLSEPFSYILRDDPVLQEMDRVQIGHINPLDHLEIEEFLSFLLNKLTILEQSLLKLEDTSLGNQLLLVDIFLAENSKKLSGYDLPTRNILTPYVDLLKGILPLLAKIRLVVNGKIPTDIGEDNQLVTLLQSIIKELKETRDRI